MFTTALIFESNLSILYFFAVVLQRITVYANDNIKKFQGHQNFSKRLNENQHFLSLSTQQIKVNYLKKRIL